jgi:tetratricopeptide (TPR) repeat protein
MGQVAGAAGAVVTVAIHAGVSYHLQLAPLLLMLGLTAAIVARCTTDEYPWFKDIAWIRRAALAVFLVHAGLLTAYGLLMPTYRIPYTLASQSQLEFERPPDDTTIQRLALATRLQPFATEARLALASAYWARCRADDTADDCARAQTLASSAVHQNLHSYEAMYLRGKYAGNVDDLLRAIEMNPRLIAARMEAAAVLISQGNREHALSVLERGLQHLAWPQPSDRAYLDQTEELARTMGRDDIVSAVAQARRGIGRRVD